MAKKHDFDAAWKSILEAFEVEIVELLFPNIFKKIDWDVETESLDKDLEEIQKDIFDKDSSKRVISDKIIKVRLKDKGSKILFIHVEVQSYNGGYEVFGERMFRYFYRIWDKFRYKYQDKSEIIAAAIYTYQGEAGKDKQYVYKPLGIEKEILTYNFKTIDVENIKLEEISDDNPLKLVFKIAKSLLETKPRDEDIYNAKIKLADELVNYDKVKNNDQIKALVDFLEYLFLIRNSKFEKKYEEYKNANGGAIRMSIDEIRRLYYQGEGREKQEEESRLKDVERVKKLLVKKFGMISEETKEKINEASSENLSIIIENILDVTSLEDAIKYLE